jgi:hypothetical protein
MTAPAATVLPGNCKNDDFAALVAKPRGAYHVLTHTMKDCRHERHCSH